MLIHHANFNTFFKKCVRILCVHVCCLAVKGTHLDASSTSVALILMPCPASKVVSLPTTTTPPFIVPKAGRQRRVTVEGRDDLCLCSACVSVSQRSRPAAQEQAVYSQGLLGISMAGHKLSFRISGGLWCKTAFSELHIPSLHVCIQMWLMKLNTYQFGEVHSFLAVLFVVLMIFFAAQLGFYQREVPVRTAFHTQLKTTAYKHGN